MARKKDDEQKADFDIDGLPVMYEYYNQNDVKQEGGVFAWHCTMRLATYCDVQGLGRILKAMKISKMPVLPDEAGGLELKLAKFNLHRVDLFTPPTGEEGENEREMLVSLGWCKIDGVRFERALKKPFKLIFNVKTIPEDDDHYQLMQLYLTARETAELGEDRATEYDLAIDVRGRGETTGQKSLEMSDQEETEGAPA